MTLTEILVVAAQRNLRYADIEALLADRGDAPKEALDVLALELARLYLIGATSFTEADVVANSMFAYAVTRGLLGDTLHGVFLAFDAGEFVPSGDAAGTDPQRKYTRPQLEQIVAVASAG